MSAALLVFVKVFTNVDPDIECYACGPERDMFLMMRGAQSAGVGGLQIALFAAVGNHVGSGAASEAALDEPAEGRSAAASKKREVAEVKLHTDNTRQVFVKMNACPSFFGVDDRTIKFKSVDLIKYDVTSREFEPRVSSKHANRMLLCEMINVDPSPKGGLSLHYYDAVTQCSELAKLGNGPLGIIFVQPKKKVSPTAAQSATTTTTTTANTTVAAKQRLPKEFGISKRLKLLFQKDGFVDGATIPALMITADDAVTIKTQLELKGAIVSISYSRTPAMLDRKDHGGYINQFIGDDDDKPPSVPPPKKATSPVDPKQVQTPRVRRVTGTERRHALDSRFYFDCATSNVVYHYTINERGVGGSSKQQTFQVSQDSGVHQLEVSNLPNLEGGVNELMFYAKKKGMYDSKAVLATFYVWQSSIATTTMKPRKILQTTLSQKFTVGSDSFDVQLADIAGIEVGHRCTISDHIVSETAIVTAVAKDSNPDTVQQGTGGTVTLSSPLENSYDATVTTFECSISPGALSRRAKAGSKMFHQIPNEVSFSSHPAIDSAFAYGCKFIEEREGDEGNRKFYESIASTDAVTSNGFTTESQALYCIYRLGFPDQMPENIENVLSLMDRFRALDSYRNETCTAETWEARFLVNTFQSEFLNEAKEPSDRKTAAGKAARADAAKAGKGVPRCSFVAAMFKHIHLDRALALGLRKFDSLESDAFEFFVPGSEFADEIDMYLQINEAERVNIAPQHDDGEAATTAVYDTLEEAQQAPQEMPRRHVPSMPSESKRKVSGAFEKRRAERLIRKMVQGSRMSSASEWTELIRQLVQGSIMPEASEWTWTELIRQVVRGSIMPEASEWTVVLVLLEDELKDPDSSRSTEEIFKAIPKKIQTPVEERTMDTSMKAISMIRASIKAIPKKIQKQVVRLFYDRIREDIEAAKEAIQKDELEQKPEFSGFYEKHEPKFSFFRNDNVPVGVFYTVDTDLRLHDPPTSPNVPPDALEKKISKWISDKGEKSWTSKSHWQNAWDPTAVDNNLTLILPQMTDFTQMTIPKHKNMHEAAIHHQFYYACNATEEPMKPLLSREEPGKYTFTTVSLVDGLAPSRMVSTKLTIADSIMKLGGKMDSGEERAAKPNTPMMRVLSSLAGDNILEKLGNGKQESLLQKTLKHDEEVVLGFDSGADDDDEETAGFGFALGEFDEEEGVNGFGDLEMESGREATKVSKTLQDEWYKEEAKLTKEHVPQSQQYLRKKKFKRAASKRATAAAGAAPVESAKSALEEVTVVTKARDKPVEKRNVAGRTQHEMKQYLKLLKSNRQSTQLWKPIDADVQTQQSRERAEKHRLKLVEERRVAAEKVRQEEETTERRKREDQEEAERKKARKEQRNREQRERELQAFQNTSEWSDPKSLVNYLV